MKEIMNNFERFWAAWPKSIRKGGKADCQKKWAKFYCETCADQIVKHVEWMKTTDQWRKDNGAYIPAPAVYLNQQRWDGAELPEDFSAETKPFVEPALEKIKLDSMKAAPMPEHIRLRLQALKK